MMDHWAAVLPGRVLTVQYEEVVADFENQVRRLLEFCGLPWEDACLRFYESERPDAHAELGAGPPADLRPLGRVTGATTRSTSTS